MKTPTRAGLAAVLALGLLVPLPAARAASPQAPPGAAAAQAGDDDIRVEVPPTRRTSGRYASVSPSTRTQADAAQAPRPADVRVTPLSTTGPSAARVDVVIVGDGYTAGEQDDFVADARRQWQRMTEVEPYRSYRGLMNVWLVEATSKDSGISRDRDTDPGAVQDKATALGGHFWCQNTERLLCVDTDAVRQYAAKAPAVDLAVVVGNSSRYGGAGYFRSELGSLPDDFPFAGIATLSSDNASSALVGAHEIGHSLGELGDEYEYCGPGYEQYCDYTGVEPEEPNVTTFGRHGEEYLRDNRLKWYRWLRAADPTGGVVGLFEGGGYYGRGLWRPTRTSIMRTLSVTEFNLPGREAMIAGFYRYGNVLHSSVRSGRVISRKAPLTVTVADVAGLAKPSPVRWYVDGREAKQARGKTTVRPQQLGVPANGRHRLSATVTDDTASVRDPDIKKAATTTLTWTVVKR